MAVIHKRNYYKVSYGNRSVTQLHPQCFDYDEGIQSVSLVVDGTKVRAAIGTVVEVANRFLVEPVDGYRSMQSDFAAAG